MTPTDRDDRSQTRALASLIAVASSHGVMHAYLVVLPPILPLIREEFALDWASLGLLVSAVSMIYGWGSIPVGIAADRLSKKKLIFSSMMLCGIGSSLAAFSTDFLSLSSCLILLAVGTSLYHPPGYSFISMLSDKLRGRYLGIQGVGGNAGMALSFLFSAYIGVTLGWKSALLVWGGIGLAIAFMDLVLISEPESRSQPQPEKKEYERNLGTSWKEMVLNKKVFLVFSIVVCSGALWQGVATFLPVYVSEAKNTSLIIAGGVSTLSYLVGSAAQLAGGELSDKRGRLPVIAAGFLGYTLCLLAITLPFVKDPIMISLTAVLLGLTFFVTQSPINALLADISPRKSRGLLYGVNFGIKYGLGGASPAVAGYLATVYAMDSVFYFFSLLSLSALVLTFLYSTIM